MNNDLKQRMVHVAIIILVATASFGLGMLVRLENRQIPVKIDYFSQPAAASLSTNVTQTEVLQAESSGAPTGPASAGSVVASKKGKKYHAPWCPGAATISAENKLFFDSPESARAAGYLPASNCKGLK